MTPGKIDPDDDTPRPDAIVEQLRDSSTTVEQRLERLEQRLSGSTTDLFDALVALATADDHVLLASQQRYQEFTKLCSAAPDSADVSTEAVLRASLEEYDRVETLSDDIQSLATLPDAAIEDRLSTLEAVRTATDRDLLASSGDGTVLAEARPGSDGESDENSAADVARTTRSTVPTETGQTMAAQAAAVDEPMTTAPGDRHQGVDQPAQRTDPTEQGSLSMPNYAQDLVDFEFVMERDEEYLPSGVNGSGIIMTDEDEYVGILRIKPRSWSIHTDAKKSEIIEAYKSAFLATLDFPVQIVSYPTKFDISDHVNRLEAVAEENESRSDDTTLVNLGRNLYPNWLERFILDNDMKQRQFYVVVPITADQLNEFQASTDGFLDALAEKAPPLEPLAERFSGGSGQQNVSREQCVRELRSRLSRIESGLRRFDVGTERLTDRDDVMSVLYHYYNNEQPMNDSFPTGPYSVAEDIGGSE